MAFAKLIGINSVLELESFKTGPAQTMYMPIPKIICINKNLPVDEKLCALAHEIGHVINQNKHTVIYELADEARGIISTESNCQVFISYHHSGIDKKIRKSVYELVYADEVKAWESAEELLRFLNIKLPRKFKFYKRMALLSYKAEWDKNSKLEEIIEIDRPGF